MPLVDVYDPFEAFETPSTTGMSSSAVSSQQTLVDGGIGAASSDLGADRSHQLAADRDSEPGRTDQNSNDAWTETMSGTETMSATETQRSEPLLMDMRSTVSGRTSVATSL